MESEKDVPMTPVSDEPKRNSSEQSDSNQDVEKQSSGRAPAAVHPAHRRHLGDPLDAIAQHDDSAPPSDEAQFAVLYAELDFANDGTGARLLTEEKGYQYLGFTFPTWKKWAILTSIFIVQISMNFNAAVYANAIPGMKEQFGVGGSTIRLGQMIFLVAYAFGCELWAPWSEELGRKWVLQGSLFLVNIWQIPCALATNFWVVFGFRFLGGLSSAGGSVTLGMVADMWEPADQQYAVAFVVFSSVAGSVVGPIAGGFITQYLHWTWVFWISLIFGAVAQAIHFFVPETRSSIMLSKAATKMRNKGHNVKSADQVRGTFRQRLDLKHCGALMWRPYKFLITEPIVGFLSLLSGFSDALIFTGLDSFGMVLGKWNFSYVAVGLSFIPLLVGYFIAYAAYAWDYSLQRKQMHVPDSDPPIRATSRMPPERRLKLLLWLVMLEPLGLLLFAFASLGPPTFHWIAPMIFSAMIGIANFAIYMATIDYMIASYGPYSASATGGNGFCRDLLAGIAALYAHPFYTNIMTGTRWQLVIPTCILSGIALICVLPVYFIWAKGEQIRKKSPWASELAEKRKDTHEQRVEAISRATTPAGSRVGSRVGSRAGTPTTSRPGSRAVSPARRVTEANKTWAKSAPVSRSNSMQRLDTAVEEEEERRKSVDSPPKSSRSTLRSS